VITQFKKQFSNLGACSAGAVAVVTAIVLPALLGFASLGVEVGHWYLGMREMQGAADAAAISAAAQYIADFPTKPNSMAYQTVGANYALTNGYTIAAADVCLVWSGSDNCATVRSVDARPIPSSCSQAANTSPCVVVEITQDTATWLTTKISLEPGAGKLVQAIPTPTLKVRAIVRANAQQQTTTTKGTDCILALANDPAAVLVHGNGNLEANCGVAIDGGLDQNVSGTALGGITFNGTPSSIHVSNLIVASGSTGCPSSHCFLFNPPTTALPASQVFKQTATVDPYAAAITALFKTTPLGVQTGGVAITNKGSGYTNGTCTFTITGGTYYTTTASPAKFTATISGGKVSSISAVTDPGAYATTGFPSGTVSATDTCGGLGASFTLTEGCWTWNSAVLPVVGGVVQALAGRKYCSINLNGAGSTNFPAGSYWIAGGDSCFGFCVSSNQATVTSDAAGVTFLLTNGDGANSRGTSAYATVGITSGTVSLCAPGTSTGTTCTTNNFGTQCSSTAGPTSCLLFVQNPAATPSTVSGLANSTTTNSFNGNGTRTLSGLIYLSKQTFAEGGNGPIQGCVGIIAKYIDVGGTPSFSNGCLPGNGIGGTTTTTISFGTPFLWQ
jgi:Flp pilus assembly protein TadG